MIVVEFEGVRHYGKPGWSERPFRVREDFGEWRPVESQDGKRIAAWLVKHGYRVLNTVGRSHDSSSYREWWGLIGVFPMETNEHGALKLMPPEVIRETFQAFRAQVEAAAAA
jgi:hypothetical protein